jgi:hypothetical protein
MCIGSAEFTISDAAVRDRTRIGGHAPMQHDEQAREKEFSLLRPELDYLDLITQRGEQCEARLHIRDTTMTHDCTRPSGHSGQHYSFAGENEYEVIWPIVPPKA